MPLEIMERKPQRVIHLVHIQNKIPENQQRRVETENKLPTPTVDLIWDLKEIKVKEPKIRRGRWKQTKTSDYPKKIDHEMNIKKNI